MNLKLSSALVLLFCASGARAGQSDLLASLAQTNAALQDGRDDAAAAAPPPAPPTPRSVPAASDRDDLRAVVAALSSEAMGGRAPMTKGSRLAREFIIDRMKSYGLEPGGEEEGFVQAVHKRVFGYKIGNNVVGYVRGRVKPDECVYVDAHYDHWGRAGGRLQPGANDNASGVALMLATARALARNPPDRTVVFLAADNEEGALVPMLGGLKGAAYQVRHPLCAPDRIKGSVVLDTVGGAFLPGLKPQLILIGSESSPGTYDLVRDAAAYGGPLPHVHGGPLALRRVSRGDRGVEVGLDGQRNGPHVPARDRADHIERLSPGARGEGAADEQPLCQGSGGHRAVSSSRSVIAADPTSSSS